MRVRLLLLVLVVLTTLSVTNPVGAIFNGEPDGKRHPAVGVLFFQRFHAPGVIGPHAACTGSLVATRPPVFITNAHCTAIFEDPAVVNAGVHFVTSYDPFNPPKLYAVASWASHPAYHDDSIANDVGVVILEKAPNVTPVRLPTAGVLDAMKAAGTIDDQAYTAVGYGCQPTATGQPSCDYDGVRRFGTFPFKSLTSTELFFSSRTLSGACSGDSGGPVFIGASNTLASLISWGDTQCRAIEGTVRLDTPIIRNFLDDYLTLP